VLVELALRAVPDVVRAPGLGLVVASQRLAAVRARGGDKDAEIKRKKTLGSV
jgi:hypothetical protein